MTPLAVIATVLGYIAVLFVVAWLSGRRADNAGFFTGNRSTPWYMAAFAMIGAAISGVTFISVPGSVAVDSFSYMQMVAGFTVGQLVVAFLLIPTFYRLRVVSLYEYLDGRFGIKAFEIFVVRNPNRIKGLSGDSYRRNDIHFIMKNNLSVLVGTITEFRNFIRRTHYGIQIIEKKGMARGSRCGTGFGTINLCGNGIPGIYKAPEEIVIVPALPCLDVYNMSHKVID